MSEALVKYPVAELKGYKSLRALNAYSALLLGLKMLPAYAVEQYESFLARVQSLPAIDQIKIFREAAHFVELAEEEVKAMICFCRDKNGVPFTAENMKNLGPQELVEVIVSVCHEISKIKIDIISEDEKKKLLHSQSTLAVSS